MTGDPASCFSLADDELPYAGEIPFSEIGENPMPAKIHPLGVEGRGAGYGEEACRAT